VTRQSSPVGKTDKKKDETVQHFSFGKAWKQTNTYQRMDGLTGIYLHRVIKL
jgi:hypothetical protein